MSVFVCCFGMIPIARSIFSLHYFFFLSFSLPSSFAAHRMRPGQPSPFA